MDLINDWAGGDLSEDCGWRFVPAICFECEIPNFSDQFCSVCSKSIIHGSNIDEQMRRLLDEIPIPTNVRRTREKARKQFIKVAEFFLFFASFDTITTPSQSSDFDSSQFPLKIFNWLSIFYAEINHFC